MNQKNPIKCSQCGNLYAVVGKAHCENPACDWIVCQRCGMIVSKVHDNAIPAPKPKGK